MSNRKPNVIVFFTDQQRWDTTGVHGNPLGLTPNFDRMAKWGTHLSHMFTCQPVCGPARSCLQTGMYATTTGCFTNRIPLPREAKTLAHYFRKADYRTGYIGKWHLAGHEPVIEEERGGYEYWLAANILEFSSDAYDTVVYDNGNKEVKLPGYRVDALADAAIRYIDDQKDHPFFLFLSFLEPHQQNHSVHHPAPPGYEDMYTSRWTPPDLAALGGTAAQHLGGYYGMVKRLDEALGRIHDALISLALSEDTIVLFTSDHGNHFNTRIGGYKRSCHESSIRVPAALTGPGFDSGGTLRELVSLIDLPPTLLDAAGIPVPPGMQGQSLMPLLRNESREWKSDVFIQISESQVGRAVRTDRWKYAVSAADKDGWQDAGAESYTEECLYDLKYDPYELSNLIGMEPYRAVAEELRDRLLARMEAAGEAVPAIVAAPSRSGGPRRVDISAMRADISNGPVKRS